MTQVPNSSEFIRVMRQMNGMVKQLDAAIKPAKPVFQAMKNSNGMARDLVSVGKRSKFIQGEYEFWKGSAQRALKAKDAVKLREAIQATEKTTKTIKDKFEAFGKGLFKGKIGTRGEWTGIGTALLTAGLLTADIKVREFLQGISQATDDTLSSDLTKAYSNISRAVLLARKNTQDLLKLKDELNKTNVNISGQNKRISDARKLGNDALYLARQNRDNLPKIIQNGLNNTIKQVKDVLKNASTAAKNANDALYETRKGREILDKKIDQNKATSTNQINLLKTQFQQLSNSVGKGVGESLTATISNLKKGIQEAKAEAAKSKDYATTIQKTLEIARGITEALKGTVKTVETTANTALTEALKAGATIKLVDGKIEVIANDKVKQALKQFVDPKINNLENGDKVLASGLTNLASEIDKVRGIAERPVKVPNYEPDINNLNQQDARLKTDIENLKKDITGLNGSIREREAVDKDAVAKLEKLIGTVGMIPPLIRSVGNDVKQSIPSQEQLTTAAAAGTCRTTQPGGCSRKMVEDVTGNAANNVNANTNDKFGQLNAALNAADLALLGTINNKLGDPVTGGLSGMLDRFSKNAIVSRTLALMTFAATLHNALMLSNNLAMTLGSIINNVLGFFGIKNGEGQSVDIGQVINSSVENFVKSLIGAEAYTQLSNDLAKANRIYQATTNLFNQLQSLHNSVLAALEVGFGWTAKIGNALKAWGLVAERAYQWMNPQPNFRWRVFQYLETAQQTASTVETIVTSVVDVKEQLIQLGNAKTEVEQALGNQTKDDTSTKAPEAQKVKETQETSKTVSAPPVFSFADLFDGED